MTVDAIIVGSGPGGATVADVLTAAGWTVTIIEKGRNHLLDPEDLTRPAFDYSNDEIKFLNRHFLGPDPLIEPRTFRTSEDDGDRLHVGEVNSVPTTVGGGGTHADGKVPRFRPDDFRVHSVFGPQPDAVVADWPLDYDELEPYYAEVERAIGVAGTEAANPFAAPRSGPFPMPSGAPMFGATRSAAAAERLGYHPYPAPTAANSVPYDGRPACNNCGFCAYFGCPTHAKGDHANQPKHSLQAVGKRVHHLCAFDCVPVGRGFFVFRIEVMPPRHHLAHRRQRRFVHVGRSRLEHNLVRILQVLQVPH